MQNLDLSLSWEFEDLPFTLCSARRGEYLKRAGEIADRAFIIKSGSVDIVKDFLGTIVPFINLKESAICGEVLLFSDTMREYSYDIVAREDCEFYVLTKEEFLMDLEQLPKSFVNLTTNIAKQFDSVFFEYLLNTPTVARRLESSPNDMVRSIGLAINSSFAQSNTPPFTDGGSGTPFDMLSETDQDFLTHFSRSISQSSPHSQQHSLTLYSNSSGSLHNSGNFNSNTNLPNVQPLSVVEECDWTNMMSENSYISDFSDIETEEEEVTVDKYEFVNSEFEIVIDDESSAVITSFLTKIEIGYLRQILSLLSFRFLVMRDSFTALLDDQSGLTLPSHILISPSNSRTALDSSTAFLPPLSPQQRPRRNTVTELPKGSPLRLGELNVDTSDSEHEVLDNEFFSSLRNEDKRRLSWTGSMSHESEGEMPTPERIVSDEYREARNRRKLSGGKEIRVESLMRGMVQQLSNSPSKVQFAKKISSRIKPGMDHSTSKSSLLKYSRRYPQTFLNKAIPPRLNINNAIDVSHLFSQWNINCWAFRDRSVVAKIIFDTLFAVCCKFELNIAEDNIAHFLQIILLDYYSNAYHNFRHALEVYHACHYFIFNSNVQNYLSVLDIIGLLIASIGHDATHPGRSSDYECKVRQLDAFVLERIHTERTLRAVEESGLFSGLQGWEYGYLRKVIKKCILATELRQHFRYIDALSSFSLAPLQSHSKPFKLGLKRESSLKELLSCNKTRLRMFICEVIIKVADLCNPSKQKTIAIESGIRATHELFVQGDLELRNGYPVPNSRNRHKTNFVKSQMDFLSQFIRPLYLQAARVFFNLGGMVKSLDATISLYQTIYQKYSETSFLDFRLEWQNSRIVYNGKNLICHSTNYIGEVVLEGLKRNPSNFDIISQDFGRIDVARERTDSLDNQIIIGGNADDTKDDEGQCNLL
ncbi:hypothetical protein PCE1_003103 [Barthelona sp. PCE]